MLSTISDLTGLCSPDRLKHRASCTTSYRSVFALESSGGSPRRIALPVEASERDILEATLKIEQEVEREMLET